MSTMAAQKLSSELTAKIAKQYESVVLPLLHGKAAQDSFRARLYRDIIPDTVESVVAVLREGLDLGRTGDKCGICEHSCPKTETPQ